LCKAWATSEDKSVDHFGLARHLTGRSGIGHADRRVVCLPDAAGPAGDSTRDYQRNGTTTLFAALEVATGKSPTAAMTGTAKPSSSTSSRPSPGPTRAASCGWYAITTTPTSTPTSTPGWPKTHGSPCISSQHRVLAQPRRGVLLHHHPPSKPPRIPRQRQRTHHRQSLTSLPDGSSAATRSCGPRPPTKSCPRPVTAIQTQDTG